MIRETCFLFIIFPVATLRVFSILPFYCENGRIQKRQSELGRLLKDETFFLHKIIQTRM